MKRVLAVVAATLLVVAAVVVRNSVIEGDDGDTDNGGELVVACIPELAVACAEIEGAEIRVQGPDDTIAAIDEGDEIDAWITLDPWPEIGELTTGRDLFGEQVAVASSPLILIVRRERTPTECQPAVTWQCLGDSAEAGRVVLPFSGRALGLLVLGHAATGYFGDATFARNDFDLDAGFRPWLDRLGSPGADPVLDMLQLGGAGPTATGAIEVDIGRINSSRESANIDLFSGIPGAIARAVVVPVRGGDGVPRPPLGRLRSMGFDVDAADVPTGLPSAGVLVALRSLYEEVSR